MSHYRRKLWARIWIILSFLLLLGGQYFFYRFSTDSVNSYAVSRGMTFGCALWTVVLVGAMWMRYGWARYILGALSCLAIVGFVAVALMLKSDLLIPMPSAMRAVTIGVAFYVVGLIPLGASQDLRNYLGPRTAGGR